MKNILKNKQKIKKEKGAVSTLVLFTVLIFLAILSGSYLIVSSLQKSQFKSDLRIQDIYQDQVNETAYLYNEIITNEIIANEIITNEILTNSL